MYRMTIYSNKEDPRISEWEMIDNVKREFDQCKSECISITVERFENIERIQGLKNDHPWSIKERIRIDSYELIKDLRGEWSIIEDSKPSKL